MQLTADRDESRTRALEAEALLQDVMGENVVARRFIEKLGGSDSLLELAPLKSAFSLEQERVLRELQQQVPRDDCLV